MSDSNDRLHLRIPADLKKRFLEKCEREAVTPSKLIRKWVEEYIREA